MLNRRNFLEGFAVSGVAFCGCSLRPAFAATAAQPAKVGRDLGVRTVDVHAHCYIPDAMMLLAAEQRAALLGAAKVNLLLDSTAGSIESRLAAMDAQGIETEVLSINPFWYALDSERAADIVRAQNEGLARLCTAHPRRFAAFASLTLQAPQRAVAELDYAVRKLGLCGAAIGGHVEGVNFSDRRFDPVWAKAQELGAMLFLHPTELQIPELDRRLAGNGMLGNVIGNPLGTTIALSHLIFQGTLDRFPDLKICSAHGGGYLPSYAARSDVVCRVAPCDPAIPLKATPSEYLRRMFYDSLVFSAEGLRHLVAEVGASQIMLGTDLPYPWQTNPVDHVMSTPIEHPEKLAILGLNAVRELRL